MDSQKDEKPREEKKGNKQMDMETILRRNQKARSHSQLKIRRPRGGIRENPKNRN